MKKHHYKGNIIIEYSPTQFTAFYLNDDGDTETEDFITMQAAKNFLDGVGTSIEW